MSFTEMCESRYFVVCPHPQLSNDRHPRTSADGWYPVLPAAMSAMYSVLSDCHGLKNFSAIGMNDVMSYAD